MLILDTNVISELMRQTPSPAVVAHVDQHAPNQVFLTSVTVGELRYGIARLPDGKRKKALDLKIRALLEEDFLHQVLPFDQAAAWCYGEIAASRERQDRPTDQSDAQIAAICLRHDAILATRNIKDFAGTSIRLINPWEDTVPT